MFRRFLLALILATIFVSTASAQLTTYTFATLPGSPTGGDLAWITDNSGTPTVGAVAAGGAPAGNRDLVSYDATQTRWEFVARQPSGGTAAALQSYMDAVRVAYANGTSGAAAIDVQAALDELFAGGDLGTTATGSALSITNTGGTPASIPAATTTTWGALTDEDKGRLDALAVIDVASFDGVAAGAGPGGADIAVTGTLDLWDRLREAVSACPKVGQIINGCALKLPSGAYQVDTPLPLWGASGDGIANTGLFGVKLLGTSDGIVGKTGAGGCGTTIQWTGTAGATMISIHGARHFEMSGICFDLDAGADGVNVAGKGAVFTAESAAGEVSFDVTVQNVTMNARALTRVLDNAYETTCIELSAAGAGSSTTNAQVDSFRIIDSWLECHQGAVFAQGSSGGVAVDNTVVNYADFGLWAEDSDLQVRGGYANTWASNSQSVGTAEQIANKAMCDDTEAFLLIGNTSTTQTEQPPAVSVSHHRLEGDCGIGLKTLQGASGVRDSATILTGVEWAFGDVVSAEPGVDYRHDGTLSISGFFGLRSGRTTPIPIILEPPNDLIYTLNVTHLDNRTITDPQIGAKARPATDIALENATLDRDFDDLPDYLRVTGDFNRDGVTDLQDIQNAIDALTDTSPRRVLVDGAFSQAALGNSAFYDATNFIEVPSNTTLECAPSARLYGPSAAFWIGRATAVRMIASAPGALDVHIENCHVENAELLAPFDGSTFITSLFGGFYLDNCTGCSVTGSTVRGSPHSAYFMVNGQGSSFVGNRAYASGAVFDSEGHHATLTVAATAGSRVLSVANGIATNCAIGDRALIELDSGAWDSGWIEALDTSGSPDLYTIRRASVGSGREPGLSDAAAIGNTFFCSEGDKHAFETYANADTVASGNVISGNLAELTAHTSFYIRGVNTEEDSASADACENDSQVTCWHKDVEVSYNVARDGGGDLVGIRGARGAKVIGNHGLRTGGILFITSPDFCSDAFDDGAEGPDTTTQFECTQDVLVSQNTITDCAPNQGGVSVTACVRINGGHEALVYEQSNFLDGVIGWWESGLDTVWGNGFAITGNLRRSAPFFRGRWIASRGFIDGLNAGGTSPITIPLNVGIDIAECGIAAGNNEYVNCVTLQSPNTALSFGPFRIVGVTGISLRVAPNSGTAANAPPVRDFLINSTRSGYSGTYTEAAAVEFACNRSTKNRWIIVSNATDANDCDISSGTGAAENRCVCDGTALADYGTTGSMDAVTYTALASQTLSGGGFFNGAFVNVHDTGRWFWTASGNASSGFVANPSFENVSLSKGPGMLTADAVQGFREVVEGLSGLTVRGINYGSTMTGSTRTSGIETADYSGQSWVQDNATPTGACSSGAIFQELDATAAGALQLCRNGALVVLD